MRSSENTYRGLLNACFQQRMQTISRRHIDAHGQFILETLLDIDEIEQKKSLSASMKMSRSLICSASSRAVEPKRKSEVAPKRLIPSS